MFPMVMTIAIKTNNKFSKERTEIAFSQFQDGYIQLCKVDARRVSFDAAEDIKTLIKMGKGKERLSFDAFHMLMHEVEVCT